MKTEVYNVEGIEIEVEKTSKDDTEAERRKMAYAFKMIRDQSGMNRKDFSEWLGIPYTFLAFGGEKDETPDLDEVVYAIGQQVRTRRWTWRQSENGKITSASTDIFFPIDGFTDFNRERVLAAQDELQMRIARIWGCKTIVGLVDSENQYMEL